MTGDLIGHASGFEILFLVSALVGAWFSRLNFKESWQDFRALGGITNGRRAIAPGSCGPWLGGTQTVPLFPSGI